MNDQQTTIATLKELVRLFSTERNWEQFHHPKDLGVALVCEVGEVLEHFRYRNNDEIQAFLGDFTKKRELAHEFADCLWLLLRLADVCQIDLAASLQEKIELAALKYPIEQVYGRADKYTAYQTPPPEGELPSEEGRR
ncbi:nucleotide pyrophosphohydrolase [Singulisphaera sp. Ch08]|uniref:Nucleotide pyrophosphohydrolase n=1 Tax=Singulisphaera sp. Ch08 TaxID=3120278 RepID=A0AAU7CC23_9BACT